MPEPLPIDEVLPAIVEAVSTAGAAVITAPTGAGKTTRVPPALLGVCSGRIVMLEPRRVASRAAARRMASERGWTLGRQAGYQVRLDRVWSDETRILVVTEGILTRMLQDDPLLEGVGAVILDEFHERSIHADLALAMVRQVRRARDGLAIVVMSATIDPEPVAAYLGGCPVVTGQGRSHPVEILHLDQPESHPLLEPLGKGVKLVLGKTGGDVLVFLPGVREIRQATRRLERLAAEQDLDLVPLYGDLPGEAQDAALEPGRRRRVVLATNVAETSITIPSVTGVLDTGLARVPRYDAATGLDRLEVVRISRASAAQRAGRAGRTAPGVCLRLWTGTETAMMREEQDPEILRIDLSSTVLELLAWGEDPERFGWFEPPGAGSIERAVRLLRRLGAVDDGSITSTGRSMSRLPVHPRLARLVLEAHGLGHTGTACLLAALLSERSPVHTKIDPERRGPRFRSRSDVLDRLAAVSGEESPFEEDEINRGAVRFIRRAGKHLADVAGRRLGKEGEPSCGREETLLRSILAAYPDKVARRRGRGSDRAVMVGGRGVRLVPESAVLDDELFVAADVDAGRRGERSELLVRQASGVEPDWLEGLVRREEHVFVEDRVRAIERTLYEDLAIREKPGRIDPTRAAQILASHASRDLDRALELGEEPLRTFRARVRFLAAHMPGLGLPDLDREHLVSLLPLICTGRSSYEEVRKAGVVEIITGTLGHDRVRALDREAPERIEVPGGSRIRLDYTADGPPILAVRIQEAFGMRDTPRVAGGRVPVMLHLLAPNMRPQQVTQDLASFWTNTYPEVRRELRGRYPKHAWPEDPMAAGRKR